MTFFLRVAQRLALGAAILLPCSTVLAQGRSPDAVWQEVREDAVPRSARARQIVPLQYRTFALDRAQLAPLLSAAPSHAAQRRVERSPAVLTLPLPDGGYGRFAFVESPVMEPELAARYPQIRTWLGQGLDDPTATVRFDLTPKGFHAQIIGVDGTTYVDPYQPGDVDHYIAYHKHDHVNGQRGQCLVGDDVHEVSKAARTKVDSGATLRTYRLAMAATGEYTAFHGGTKLDAMSAIATTMNRVNGLYEREASVRMVLVANNDAIVYTDAATDPYANTSGDLNANQSNIDAVIGSANYDIGHLVGTGGGGIAQLRSPCGSSKARGLTGSGAPLGDAFDIDYVAHEMGHQFGGNHTFNGSGGSCSGTNRNATTAYEPGSGVTIQAYAGICGGDDLQPNSEDYFHRLSLNEILAFTTNPLTGASCGVASATGNAVPTVSAPATVTIPGRTPFTLAATGSDGDGDALTYVWEQFDLGAANAEGVLSPTTATGPMFRGFTPSTSPQRTFPSWRYILANANVPPATAPLPGTASPAYMTGEVLPDVSRNLTFRVTVRDNRAGGGGTNEAGTTVVVDNTAGPFEVTAPNTAVSLAAGAATTVTWNVARTTLVPITAANVRISLSIDGGASFPFELAASTPNDGTQSVTLPAGVATTRARIKVEAVGNVFFDVSDADFTLTAAGNAPPTINVTGSVTARQGAPAASAVVASVSDAQDAAGTLGVSVSGAPPELAVSVQNLGGSVTLTATAACGLVAPTTGTKAYPVVLTVADSGGGTASANVNVLVAANRAPTLGAYSALDITLNTVRTASPAPLAADADGNLSATTVSPTTLPGGGTVAIAPDGVVTVTTTAGTTLGASQVVARVADACGAEETRALTINVGAPQITLVAAGLQVVSGNALVEPNECNQFNLVLRNDGNTTATNVSASLSTLTGNVALTQPTAAFPDIPAGESRGSLTPFEISTDPAAACFSNVALTASVSYSGAAGSPATLNTSLPIGRPAAVNYAFAVSGGATLPNDGTLVPGSNGDDTANNGSAQDPVVTLTTPFAVSLYGVNTPAGTSVRASTNGNLQFRPSQGANDFTNTTLPAVGTGNGQSVFPPAAPTLFVLWDDWRMDTLEPAAAADAGIYTKVEGTAPNRQWIIEWRGRIRGDGAVTTNNNRAGIVLYENSENFDFVYVATGAGASANGAGSTIGVQSSATGNFTQFAFNNANLAPGTRLSATRLPALCNAGSGTCPVGAAGVTIAQSGGSTDVTEGGATDTYTVVLDAAPSGNVTITPSPGAQLSTSPSTLTFTPGNWNVAQPVTVTAVNDAVAEGAHTGTITHAASGGGYNGVVIANVVADITDNDTAGVTVVQSGGSTDVTEGGATDSYTLVLTSQPTADVTIALTPDAQVQVPASVVFTPADWNVAKPVTVTAANDAVYEGAHTGTIAHAASGGGYAGVAIADVVANITDDDPIPVDLAVATTTVVLPAAGQRVEWETTVDNLSGNAVATASFDFTATALVTGVTWTCVADPGSSCPASGNGVPSHAIALGAGGGVTYSIGGDVPAGTAFGTLVETTASIAVAAPYTDTASGNDIDATADPVSANRPPVAVGTIADQSGSENVAIAPLATAANFNDPDGDTLTYSATGLPPGLSIDTASGVVSGTPTFAAAGSHAVTVTARDPSNASATQSFNWTIANTNRAPTAVGTIADQSGSENTAIAPLATAGNFADADGEALTYSATGLPPGLSIDTASGVVSGTPTFAAAGSYSVTVTARDPANAAATQSFGWTIANTNRAPTAVGTIADQSGSENTAITPLATAGNFADADGEALTYSATGLPPGLSIDTASGVVSGTPTFAAAGSYSVTVTARDPANASATQSFGWTIANTNRAPTITNEPYGFTVVDTAAAGTPVGTVTATDADGEAPAFSIAGGNTGNAFAIDPASGAITVATAGVLSGGSTVVLTVRAADAGGLDDTTAVTITVQSGTPLGDDIFQDGFEN